MALITLAPEPAWAAGVATGLRTVRPLLGGTPLMGVDPPVPRGLPWISSSRQFQLWGRG